MEQFVYEPLEEGSIRLLYLLPYDNEGGPLQCTIRAVPLADSEIEYEALSYAWGSQRRTHGIELCETRAAITSSLDAALRSLRRKSGVRTLWVDAVCIDQDNYEERASQIKLMAPIFQNATRVVAWLGGRADDSDNAIAFLKHLAELTQSADELPVPYLYSKEIPRRTFAGVRQLLQRPYWVRLWVAQEIALADDPELRCGSMSISWNTFRSGLFHLQAFVRGNTYVLKNDPQPPSSVRSWRDKFHKIAGEPREVVTDLDIKSKHFDRFFDLEVIKGSVRFPQIMGTPHTYPQDAERTNIARICDYTRYLRCTQPHDAIYALLGLIRSQPVPNPFVLDFQPDYSQPFLDTCILFTKAALQAEGTLELLHIKNHITIAGWPSWCPCYGIQHKVTLPSHALNPWKRWSASGRLRNLLPWSTYTIEGHVLSVRGRLIDKITQVLDLSTFRMQPSLLLRHIYDSVIPVAGHSFYNVDALWRTLLQNTSSENEYPCSASYGVAFQRVLANEKTSADIDIPLMRRIHKSVFGGKQLSRTFFVTKAGRFGLGPPELQEGDAVTLLQGFSMPAMLRSCGADLFTYMGTAYIHGMMHGEAGIEDKNFWPMLSIK